MKYLIVIAMSAVITCVFSSCSKDTSSSTGSEVQIYTVPPEIAVRYVGYAFCNNASGINLHIENDAALTAGDRGTFDSIFTRIRMDTAAIIKYNYSIEYTFIRTSDPAPRTTLDYTAEGGFSASDMNSQDFQTGNIWHITNLDQPELTLNGSGSDAGQQQAIPERIYFTSTLSYTLKDLKISSTTHMIDSGTASIHINGNGPGNVSFTYSGNMTFTGNRTAMLAMQGTTYQIDLVTGATRVFNL